MLDESINRFINEIKDTPEFREFKMRRDLLAQHPDLKAKTGLYVREHFRLLQNTPPENLFEAEKKFADEHESIYNTPMIHEYLDSQAAFDRLLRDVLEQITDGLSL